MVDVVLVDDHDLVRTGLRVLLEKTGDFRVVGDYNSAREGIAACKSLQPAVAVLDLSIPGLDGIEATAEVTRACPNTRVVVLTAYQDESAVVGAVRAGASGYVLKKARAEELILDSAVGGLREGWRAGRIEVDSCEIGEDAAQEPRPSF